VSLARVSWDFSKKNQDQVFCQFITASLQPFQSTYKFFQKLLGNNHDVESLSFDEVFFFLVFTHFQWKK
jgi:hypothetical protein